jgi:hypothetical protein
VENVCGKSLLRRRGESVKRSFAHCYETGGIRRTHFRGHGNILKRQLIHVGAFNLSLILRALLGSGKPREWKNQQRELLLRLFLLLPCWNGPNRPAELASSIFSMSFDANHSIKRRRPRFRNSDPCTTGC